MFLRTAVSCGRWSCWDSKHFGCWCVEAQDSFGLNMFHYNYRGAVSSLLSHQHWTPNSKTKLEDVSVVPMYDNGDSIESHAAAAQQDLYNATHSRCLPLVTWVYLRACNFGLKIMHSRSQISQWLEVVYIYVHFLQYMYCKNYDYMHVVIIALLNKYREQMVAVTRLGKARPGLSNRL